MEQGLYGRKVNSNVIFRKLFSVSNRRTSCPPQIREDVMEILNKVFTPPERSSNAVLKTTVGRALGGKMANKSLRFATHLAPR